MRRNFFAAVLCVCMAVFPLCQSVWAASPVLELSQDYQSSVYAQRLDSVELSGNWRADLVRVALSQVGYHEGDSDWDKNGGSYEGSGNFTEYSKAYYGMDGQWCAMFVSWCARQAGIPTYAINNACGAFADHDGSKGNYGFHVCANYKKNYIPIPGDLVFFTTTGWGTNHVGIVAEVTDSGIYSVEGNAMDAVRVKYYPLDSDDIVYYGVYSWQEQLVTESLSVTKLEICTQDGKHGTMPDGDPYKFQSLWALADTEITIPLGGFARDGYTLAGYAVRRNWDGAWYSSSNQWIEEYDGSYLPDNSRLYFDAVWQMNGDLTLYCIWRDSDGNLIPDSAVSSAVQVVRSDSFADLYSTDWYCEDVERALDFGIIGEAPTFRGGDDVTRAEFVQMLYAASGDEVDTDFEEYEDVSELDASYKAIAWSRINGLTEGDGNNCFYPDRTMSRQEMAAMLYRWQGEKAEKLCGFADLGQIDFWAVEAMAWTVGCGFLRGIEQNETVFLCPRDSLSRAQAVTVVMRVVNSILIDN